jgi:predicted NBD/HSP70 family sugar kinase
MQPAANTRHRLLRAGIDIGGTKTDAVLIDDIGTVVDRERTASGFGREAVLTTALGTATRLAERNGIQVDQLASVGVGIPGMVDASGVVGHAVNLGIMELDVRAELSRRLGTDVLVENDVNAAAIGAYRLLGREAGSKTASLAYLNLGTGLAAGIVLNGRLWRGSSGVAGEIGHIPTDPNGPLCRCGQRGCLEAVASGYGLSQRWPSADPVPAIALFCAADAGESAAVAARDGFLTGAASAVRLLVAAFDVDTVVLGGGLSALGEPLLSGMRRTFAEWSASSAFIASLNLADRVQLVPDDTPVAALGAAYIGQGDPVRPGAR